MTEEDKPEGETKEPEAEAEAPKPEAEADKAEAEAPEPAVAAKEDAKEDAKEGADESSSADDASPEAVARRVAALGEDDESEQVARDEERKLAERRAQKRGKGGAKKKKAGLEAAASKRLKEIGTRAPAKRRVATAVDADPLIARTVKIGEWAKKNQRTVQVLGAALVVALLGLAGFLYMGHKHEIEASVLLTKAIEAERAPIGEPPAADEVEPGAPPTFKTFEARTDAVLTQYREIEAKFPKTGAAILARLGEGSLLLDKKDADGALKAFEDVKASPLAAADQEVKGRALEGSGFAYELKAAAAKDAERTKLLDRALKSYKELENTVDVKGFKELAMYHQARVLEAEGKKDEAKKGLAALIERLNKPDDNVANIPQGPAFPYLREVATDRLRALDPAAMPSPQMSPAQLRKIIEEAKKKQQQGGGDPHP